MRPVSNFCRQESEQANVPKCKTIPLFNGELLDKRKQRIHNNDADRSSSLCIQKKSLRVSLIRYIDERFSLQIIPRP